MKTGLKTTEFWLALIVALLGGMASIYATAEWARIAGLLAAALTSMGYGLSRASVKKATIDKGVVFMTDVASTVSKGNSS